MAAKGMDEHWRRFYQTIARVTPEQVDATLDRVGPMLRDGEGARRLAAEFGLDWCWPEVCQQKGNGAQ